MPLMSKLAHFVWPARFIAPSRPAVRQGSACPWLALRAAVLRLAVSPWALPGTAARFFALVGFVLLAAGGHGLIVWQVLWLTTALCLTLPSRGRHKGYALAPPLMSNVSRHQCPTPQMTSHTGQL